MPVMKNPNSLLLALMLCCVTPLFAQNPFIGGQFTADPTARVFNGKMYVYPSHDIPTPPTKPGRKDWFCMEDYHVFSSKNLTDWHDHGVIVTQSQVAWVDSTSYSMWAPDCVEKGGKYYFYFPANINPALGRGFGVGVGIADSPEGPFRFEKSPIQGISGIDPCVLIDKDGQAYIYWSGRGLSMAKLKDNMLELASEPVSIEGLPDGFKEGPFVFERNGKYYLTYPHVRNNTEELAYSVGDSPMGPFTYAGVIMDESPVGCWTNHHSIVEYNKQWYLFYHHNDYSPKFDKNRSVRVDSLSFASDGKIEKVIPTLRGVGVTLASEMIQPDRYSQLSENGASIALHDSVQTFAGWYTKLAASGAWVRYNTVDFGSEKSKNVEISARSSEGGVVRVCAGSPDGEVIAEISIPKSADWKQTSAKVSKLPKGVQDLYMVNTKGSVELDWIRFALK